MSGRTNMQSSATARSVSAYTTETLEAPALTFVHQDLAKEARSMADHGFDFRYLQLDEDAFNELGFVDHDNHMISMIEARTFSRPTKMQITQSAGGGLRLLYPCAMHCEPLVSGRRLHPNSCAIREEPTTHMRFNAAGMSLGLSESIALSGPSLCFRCDDKEAVWIALAKHGFEHHEFPGFEGAFMSITAPEGTMLFLFDEDFLGELYEVEETDEP